MTKTEKVIFFIAIALILGGVTLCVFFPGEPLFIPVAIGCLLLQVLRTTIVHRVEQAIKNRKRGRTRRALKSGVSKLAATIAGENQHLTDGNKPRRQGKGQKGILQQVRNTEI